MLSIPPVEAQSFSILTAERDGEPLVKFSGNGDSVAEQPLDQYLIRLHRSVVLRRLSVVWVDVTQLYFMNSSCIKAFANWIHDVQAGDHRYLVRVLVNPGLNWQKRTLKPLARLAPTLVQLQDATG